MVFYEYVKSVKTLFKWTEKVKKTEKLQIVEGDSKREKKNTEMPCLEIYRVVTDVGQWLISFHGE